MMAFHSGFLSAMALAGLASVSVAPAWADGAASVPQNDNLNAALWDQTSVEFKANASAIYALGKMRLDEALADKSWTAAPVVQTGDFADLPPAVILDCDDTIFNTSAYQAWAVKNDTSYSGKTWTDYVNAKLDVPIPGAVEFTQYAASKGVKVFYVTNRTAEEEGPTVEEMTKMGFPMGGNVDTFLALKEKPEWTSAKGTRRAYIAKNYRIVLLFGDNMGDFTDEYTGSVVERDAVYKKDATHWGHDWLALANPTYGSFESAPFLSDYSKSVDQRRQLKIDALSPWIGPAR